MSMVVINRIFLFVVPLLVIFTLSCITPPSTKQITQKVSEEEALKEQEPASLEISWDKLVKEARKDKRLSLYSVPNGELRVALVKAMREKFGLEMDIVTAGGGQLAVKIFNERRAGIYNVDVYIGGAGGTLGELKSAGIFEPLEPQLLLPEVLDSKVWWEGRLPWWDRDKQVLAFAANPSPPLTINTRMAREEDIKSYRDLLNPRWKGKMILNDPTMPGVAQWWFMAAASRIVGLDFMRELARMDLTVTRDQRLQVEWLAQGKYSIAIAAKQSTIYQFKKEGAPLNLFTPQEGTHITSSSSTLVLPKNAPHSAAARLFINWLLSREGQTLFSEAMGFQSARNDVPTGHLDPASTRKEGGKYFSTIGEDFEKVIDEYAEYAREIFSPLLK